MARITARQLIRGQLKRKQVTDDEFIDRERRAFLEYQEKNKIEFVPRFAYDMYKGITCDFDIYREGRLLAFTPSEKKEDREKIIEEKNRVEEDFVAYMKRRRVVIFPAYMPTSNSIRPIVNIRRLQDDANIEPEKVELPDGETGKTDGEPGAN